MTRRRGARSGDGGRCDGVACGVSIFFSLPLLYFYHLYIIIPDMYDQSHRGSTLC